MARKQKQKPKQKAVKSGKKPAGRPRKFAAAAATSPEHDAAPAPKTAASEQKKPTMTGGISKKTSRRMPARSGKKDPWSEEQLTTSKKSRIIDIDLVKLFANPNSWTCLEEDEKRELLSLLPAHVHPNPGPDPENPDHKIEPLPQSFLRYSNNWRDAVRAFQSDLENGRYDPAWQAQAAVAMEERASGKFDSFKEDQYEEFWGQKQKLSWDVETGDSNQVKLETLVLHGVVKPGDVWKYSRIYVKDKVRILLEKELKILSVDKSNYSLTFAIPGGHRYSLKNDYPITDSSRATSLAAGDDNASPANESKTDRKTGAKLEPKQEIETVADAVNGGATEAGVEAEDRVGAKPVRSSSSPKPAEQTNMPIENGELASKEDTSMPNAPPADKGIFQQNVPDNKSTKNAISEATVNEESVADNTTPDETIVGNDTPGDSPSNGAMAEDSAPGSSITSSPVGNYDAAEPDADVILPGVLQPNSLNVKILKIDGRITKPSHGNAWKDFRCIRNNQDMGSLWEVRQLWAMKGK